MPSRTWNVNPSAPTLDFANLACSLDSIKRSSGLAAGAAGIRGLGELACGTGGAGVTVGSAVVFAG